MFDTALFLLADGLTNGAVYAQVALSLVLVYSVTRVVNIAQGEYVMLGALTYADLLDGRMPATMAIVVTGLALWGVTSAWTARHNRRAMMRVLGGAALACLVLAGISAGVLAAPRSAFLAMPAAILLVASLGPIVYRVTVQPNPNASTVVLVIISVGVDMVLQGVGLLFWGSSTYSVAPLANGGISVGPLFLAWQSIAIIAIAIVIMAALYAFFEFTLYGKALQATAINRLGAQFCGIPVARAGALAFFLGAAFSATSGMLLAPLVTAHYDMGFVIGLKGFVGSAMGGLIDYPLALAGVFAVGVLESTSAYAWSAYREVLVFALLIPILLWRSHRLKPGQEA
ncbi:branched-chain amino acid ABC transporter permease [Reyranella sp. CPCC 100927]|uniref:branched-chain amino acid ABC transporter permease n=1 Tax=Reyranella sp. CPCC 100927 TaxID=2599616 RepID=UPI0011B73E22|nr:branched-chain amino acid ABC transporter permease [Reyranella sp. CPCC 100927]TWT12874.1 branched-chain amino acid ABC transporter permease [Reyranella sp. CPCC 100927]